MFPNHFFETWHMENVMENISGNIFLRHDTWKMLWKTYSVTPSLMLLGYFFCWFCRGHQTSELICFSFVVWEIVVCMASLTNTQSPSPNSLFDLCWFACCFEYLIYVDLCTNRCQIFFEYLKFEWPSDILLNGLLQLEPWCPLMQILSVLEVHNHIGLEKELF